MTQTDKFAGLHDLRAQMTPPMMRGRWPGYINTWLACLATALLPLAVPLLAGLLATPVPSAPLALAEADLPPALTAGNEARAALLDDAAPTLAEDPALLAEQLAALEAMAAAEAAQGAAEPLYDEASAAAAHRLYQARSRVLLALGASIAISLSMALAQYRILNRHTEDFWPAGNRGLPVKREGDLVGHRPVYLVPHVLLGGGLVAVLLLAGAGMVPPWLAEPAPLLGERLLWAVLLGLALASFVTVALITALGARIFAGNYPDIVRVERIGEKLLKGLEIRQAEKNDATEAEIATIQAIPVTDQKWKASVIADAAEELWRLTKRTSPTIPVNRGLAPRHLKAALDALMVALLPALVAGLVAAALWLDLAEAGMTGSDTYLAALGGTDDVLMIAAGLGSSAMLALIYLPAATRLAPYVAAEADAAKRPAPAKPGNWRFGSISPPARDDEGRTAELAMWEPEAEAETPDFPRPMRLQLGCSRAKFIAIMQAAKYGGGLHEMLGELGSARLKEAAALLAPTATGFLLALIG
ncbi:hypothetical protein ACXN5S_08140 [Pseudoroseicyclus sp. H15]